MTNPTPNKQALERERKREEMLEGMRVVKRDDPDRDEVDPILKKSVWLI